MNKSETALASKLGKRMNRFNNNFCKYRLRMEDG